MIDQMADLAPAPTGAPIAADRHGSDGPAPSPRRIALARLAENACARVAPLWPLRHFVAVNPFLGLTHEDFATAAARMRHVAGVEMLMPHGFFRSALGAGRIAEADLAAALAASPARPGVPSTPAALRQALAADPAPTAPHAVTVAEVLAAQGDARLASFVVDEIAKWLAAYWDHGQAAWRSPWRHLPPYPAWRAAAGHDRTPDSRKLRGIRAAIAELPDDPLAAIEAVIRMLELPDAAVACYLHRAIAGIGGWAAYARYLAWNKALSGRHDDTTLHLLAIRLAWDAALFATHDNRPFRQAWSSAVQAMAADDLAQPGADLAIGVILQDAYERGFQRGLIGRLAGLPAPPPAQAVRPRMAVQAAFCIDVRSEVFRRALEHLTARVETIGFAGFFGFPIEYVPIGHHHGGAQCPVLLSPKFVICEAVKGTPEADETRVLTRRILRRKAARAWKAFKTSAVSSFAFVETAGLLFGAKLVSDSAGLTRTVSHPARDGIAPAMARRLGPRLTPRRIGGRDTGLTTDQRVATAETALRGMSLTGGFARLVMLAGHGSSTVNNPHATGLDCGACGGHSGEANARVAAAILNDPEVRAGLAGRGIAIPADTWFVSALHDTTTDTITLHDPDEIPASHQADIAALRGWTEAAAALARAERAASLGIPPGDQVDARIRQRSRDWSQVRPEWGLAGNAAFIAAPRGRTRGIDLAGRVFLHSYDHRQDGDGSVLELIMTAPVVVASWINLQYYGSVTDNRQLGAGNKVLHNVVGTLGVLEGNGGDLRVGLPWQSLHDGRRLMHEPLRLSVLIEAPQDAIERVVAKHPGVRDLIGNRWVHLFAIGDDGTIARRIGAGNWVREEAS